LKCDGKADGDGGVLESSSPASHSPDVHHEPTLDELLSFIEGKTAEERSKRAAKRARQKQRKENDKRAVEQSSAGESAVAKATVANDDGAGVLHQPGRGDADAKKKKGKKKNNKGDEQRSEGGKILAACGGPAKNGATDKVVAVEKDDEDVKKKSVKTVPGEGANPSVVAVISGDAAVKKKHDSGAGLQTETLKSSSSPTKKKVEISKTKETPAKEDKKLDDQTQQVIENRRAENESSGKHKRDTPHKQEGGRSFQLSAESQKLPDSRSDDLKKRRPQQLPGKKNALEQKKPSKEDKREPNDYDKRQKNKPTLQNSSKDDSRKQPSAKSTAVNGLIARKVDSPTSDRLPKSKGQEKEESGSENSFPVPRDLEAQSSSNTSGSSTPEKSLLDAER